ncbi:MAG: hypothetical protein C0191_04675 [Mucilaginibacter sp.]|nr:MAG: hypothetical protein C0191_04675 [Mucilaginibacter sp.]
MKNKDILESFPYDETIGGKEHHYRITQNVASYGIEQDGVIIAEVAHDDLWKQLSGEPLAEELLESICDHIENYFA